MMVDTSGFKNSFLIVYRLDSNGYWCCANPFDQNYVVVSHPLNGISSEYNITGRSLRLNGNNNFLLTVAAAVVVIVNTNMNNNDGN